LLFEELVATPNVVVTNQEGGGGAVAFADIAANRNDEDDLTIAASPATAIRFGQNAYDGLTADQFRWIGAIGADFGVLAVPTDSPYESVADIVTALQADPTSITFGGGSPVGGQDHFKLLMFAQEIGVDPAVVPWVAYDGGGEAQAALLGGEIEVAPLDVSEVFGNEDLNVLGVMSTDPIEGMDAPTLIEEGVSMIFPVWRGLLAPGGMSDEAYDFWVDALGQVEASPEWAVERAANGLSPLRLLGDDFETFALDAVADFRALSEPFGLVVGVEPTEPAYVATAPECVAPSGAGGGWDFTCRSIGLLFEEMGLTPNVVVTNQEGGGGAIAFADIAANRNDEDDLTIAASPATAIRFGQNQYGGLTADQFRWVGAIGADFGAFVVTPDSPYQTLDDLVAAMQADPTAITFGGGSPVGGQDHFKLLMFAEEIGVDPAVVPWVAYDGGGEAQAALLGGEIEVAPLDVSEVFGNEDLLVLAVMASDPVDGMDAPTTVELGYETIFPVWRGLLAPGGMSDEAYDFWVDALGQVEASEEWAVARAENGLSPLRLLGADFQTFALDAVQSFHDLSEPFGLVIE
jgi:putative tricarboxylic transport membrane protein